MKKIVPIAILIFVLAIGVFVGSVQAGTSSLTGWAWSSNIGWVSFNSANSGAGGGSYSVKISTSSSVGGFGDFSDHAWSSNIGWISFNRSETGNPPSDDIGSGSGRISRVDMSSGAVTGWARALSAMADPNDGWDGWIHLSGTNHLSPDESGTRGVTYYPEAKSGHTAGSFAGYAWGSDVVGWLNFYNVATTLAGSVTPPPSSNSCAINGISKSGSNALLISTTMTPALPLVSYDLKVSTNNGATYNPVPVGSTNSNSPMPYVFTHNITPTPGSTYTYRIFVSGTQTTCGSALPYTEPVLQATGNVNLFIGANLTAATRDTLIVKKGDPFTLKWSNVLLDQGYSCSASVNPNISSWTGWGNSSGGNSSFRASDNGASIDTVNYTFTISCAKTGFIDQNDSVTLQVKSSSIKEK